MKPLWCCKLIDEHRQILQSLPAAIHSPLFPYDLTSFTAPLFTSTFSSGGYIGRPFHSPLSFHVALPSCQRSKLVCLKRQSTCYYGMASDAMPTARFAILQAAISSFYLSPLPRELKVKRPRYIHVVGRNRKANVVISWNHAQ